MKQWISWFSALLAIVFFSAPVSAADSPQPELKITKTDVKAYKELRTSQVAFEYGVNETISFDGKLLLHVTAEIAPQWTEEIDNARVDDENIKLIAGGEEIFMIGYFERYGQFRISTDSFSAYRDSNWKEKPRPVYYNAVFAVPEGTKTCEFKLGTAVSQIQIPEPIPAPKSLETVKIEIVSARTVDEIKSQKSVGDLNPEPVTVVTSPGGKLLELQLKLTPLKGNGDNPDHFFWYTPWFGILAEDGGYIPTIGEIFMDKLNNSVSHNLNLSSDGNWSTGEATLYFSVPPDLTSFELTYLDEPATRGSTGEKKEEQPEAEPKPEDAGKKAIKKFFK